MSEDTGLALPMSRVSRAGDSVTVETPMVALTRAAMEATGTGQVIEGAALVLRADSRQDRTGRPYAALLLRGGDGATIEARWWQLAGPCPQVGTVYQFTGQSDRFNGVLQLKVQHASEIPGADMTPFARATHHSPEELCAELENLLAPLDADWLALVRQVLSGSTWERFLVWPAAQLHHGAVRHGLLAHSVGVARLALALGDSYGEELSFDRGLVVTAALLHDIGKVQTLPPLAGAAPPDLARQLDHVTLGVLMVRAAAAQTVPPLSTERLHALLHVLLAHHGRREWGAPVEPQTAEAWLVHLADLAESRLCAWLET